jgi:hypothetical protein
MKTFTLIFLWSTSLMSQDVKQDKLAHFGAGALVSILSYGPIHKYTKSTSKALVYSTACAFLVGAAKEVYDINHGKEGFGAEDLAQTTFGGLMASSFITIRINNKEKRKQLEKIEKFKKEEELQKEIPYNAAITGLGAVSK